MKIRIRRRPHLSPLLLATTLPAASLGLLSLSSTRAEAQIAEACAEQILAQALTAPYAALACLDTGAEQIAPYAASARSDTNAKQTAEMGALAAPMAQSTASPPTAQNTAQQDTTQPVPVIKPEMPTTPTVNGPVIEQFIVTGNKTLNKESIIASSLHKVGDPLTNKTLDEIKTNVYATGLYGRHTNDPEKAVDVYAEKIPNSPNGWKITIHVDENETVKNVTIEGSGPVKPEKIAELIHINRQVGSVYSEAQFGRDVRDIQDYYSKLGYVAVILEGGPDPDNPGFLKVVISVARVSEIKLEKLHKTKPKVVLREMKTKVNDYFNRKTFNDDLRRLYNLDLFEDVTPADRTLGVGKIGITLSLPEKRTGTISLAVGYSNREQLVGRAEVSETNFRGMAETLTLLWETGGAANRNSVELGFSEPWLDNKHTSLGVQLYDKTIYRFSNSLQSSIPITTNVGTDTRYNEQHTGATLTFSRPLREKVRGAITLRGENIRTDPLALSGVNADIIQNGPIYSIATSLLRNTRDLDLDPVSGAFQDLRLELGHANLKPVAGAITSTGAFGSANFLKTSLEWQQFYSLQGPRTKLDQEKTSLALRLLLGASTGKLPFFEQFFIGGAETLRGYRDDRFWGSNALLASIELRQPLARRLKGVLFLDAGDAWGGAFSNINISGFQQSGFSPRVGVGAGIRVGTPIGTLGLDFGFGSEGGRTHFRIGNVF